MHNWFDQYEILAPEELTLPLAKTFVRHIEYHSQGVAVFKESRKGNNGVEWVIVDLTVSQPTFPKYDLKDTETLAVLFSGEDRAPGIYSCREDFPDTPHQNCVSDGMPYSLCIDNRPWEDAKLTYTPGELLSRIVLWLERAGRDELHGADQPLDPNFMPSAYTFIYPQKAFNSGDHVRRDFACVFAGESGKVAIILEVDKQTPPPEKLQALRMALLALELPPKCMTRMRSAPRDMGSLQQSMQERGVNLIDLLTQDICARGRDDDLWKAYWLQSHLIILVKMPLIAPGSDKVGATQTLAFITEKTIGEMGELFGILAKNNCTAVGEIPYLYLLNQTISSDRASEIRLDVANVAPDFDTELAALLAGRNKEDTRNVLMVGAGSVGSLVAESLAREGRFSITLIDRDLFFPHNAARHALFPGNTGDSKAHALVKFLECIRIDGVFEAIADDFLRPNNGAAIDAALNRAEILMDASASVAVSRHLCDLPADGRRVSFFYCPDGNAAVLMVEDSDRRIDLRALEAMYYAELQSYPDLADLLTAKAEMLQYSGNCGALTNRMAASKAQVLSGLITQGLTKALDSKGAWLQVWRMHSDGSVSSFIIPVGEPLLHQLGEWTVRVMPKLVDQVQAVRLAKLPNETGGALLGVVDVPKRKIDVISAIPAPPDSVEKPTEFRRGLIGLRRRVEESMQRTGDQTRYVGEWHSHPRGCGPTPSGIDILELGTLTATLSADGCPGVQLIASDQELGVILGVIEETT